MSDGMRIAVIGVVASLLGTLIGGGVTYAVTQSQISSDKSESRRADRLSAYSTFFGDTEKFWTYVFTIAEVDPRPRAATAAQREKLNTYGETLIGDYAQIALLAPKDVGHLAQRLEQAKTLAWNALESVPIEYRNYTNAASQIVPKNGLIKQFATASRHDLGTP